MVTEKQIQTAVTKYNALRREKEKLETECRTRSAKYYEAQRKLEETSKKMQTWAKKSIAYDVSPKKRGILKIVEKRVWGD